MFIILWWTDGCSNKTLTNNGVSRDTIRTEITYRYDTIIHTIEKHSFTYRDSVVMIPSEVDSGQVIRDYFTRRDFADTYADSNLSATYSGQLFKNEILNTKLEYTLLKPQTIIQNTVLESTPTRKLSLGAFAGYLDKPTVGALAIYSDRRDRSFLIGYGINQTVLIGVTGKIKLHK